VVAGWIEQLRHDLPHLGSLERLDEQNADARRVRSATSLGVAEAVVFRIGTASP
jgi:hypothetical protein